MTAAEDIRHHQARCQPYLLRLRMLTRGGGGPTLTAAEVSHATGAIVAEARAASRVALANGDSGHPGARTFLAVRLNRLARAAEEAIAAAREGDASGLRRHLYRFEALTSAIWTAQHAVCGPALSVGNDTGSQSAAAGKDQATAERWLRGA